MEGFKLNDEIKHIFSEALLDFYEGAKRGSSSAVAHYGRFSEYILNKEVPVSDIGFLFKYYQNQENDLKNLDDKRLDPLKAEVRYMVNFLNSKYNFEQDGNTLKVTMA